MSVATDGTNFDNVYYDAAADVLYLHVGDPHTAVDFDESPEGHALRYDADGRLVGITIVGAKYFLEKDGRIEITELADKYQSVPIRRFALGEQK